MKKLYSPVPVFGFGKLETRQPSPRQFITLTLLKQFRRSSEVSSPRGSKNKLSFSFSTEQTVNKAAGQDLVLKGQFLLILPSQSVSPCSSFNVPFCETARSLFS